MLVGPQHFALVPAPPGADHGVGQASDETLAALARSQITVSATIGSPPRRRRDRLDAGAGRGDPG